MISALRRLAALSVTALSLALVAGCSGASSEAAPAPAVPGDSEEDFGDELRKKTDAQVKAEIEAAAQGAIYVSEGDYPFTFVTAPLDGARTITEAIAREKLASYVDASEDADKPMASLFAQGGSFSEWKRDYTDCTEDAYPGPEECAAIQKMNEALTRNLRGVKVFYFGSRGEPGSVDGTAVSVFIVGRTPQGSLAGVWTIAIWT